MVASVRDTISKVPKMKTFVGKDLNSLHLSMNSINVSAITKHNVLTYDGSVH